MPRPALVTLCLAQFLVVLDFSVVTVALSPIGKELRMDATELQWVVSAYALAFGGLLLLGGRAADVFGRKRLLLGGLAVFCLASIAGGAATSPWLLIAARALQGVGAAAVSPAALALLTASTDEGPERNRALAVWSAVGASAIAAGVLLGGVVVEFLDWRWTLWLNAPVCVALVVAVAVQVREHERCDEPLDALGALLATVAIVLVIVGLGRLEEGVGAVAVGALVAGTALLAGFALHERRAKRPLLPVEILRQPGVRAANATALLTVGVFAAVFFLLSLELRGPLELGALATGLVFLPVGIIDAVVAAWVGGRVVERLGARGPLVLGMALTAGGLVSLALWHGSWAAVLVGLCLVAFGMGFAHPAFTIGATDDVEDDDQGAASGLLTTSQQVGSALALALFVGLAGSRGLETALLAAVAFPVLGVVVTLTARRRRVAVA